MKLTAKQYAQTLFEVLQDTSTADYDKVIDNFTKVLSMNNDLALFDEIEKEYSNIEKNSTELSKNHTSINKKDKSNSDTTIIENLNQHLANNIDYKIKVGHKKIDGFLIPLNDVFPEAD